MPVADDHEMATTKTRDDNDSKNEPSLAFVSLATVVLDELRGPSLPEPQRDVPGGSATFAVMGARVACGSGARAWREIGCPIMAGHDFPDAALGCFESWGVALNVKRDTERPSTRGLLEYLDADFGRKSFRYTTPLIRPQPADLSERFLGAASFHLLAQPAELQSQVADLLRLRSAAAAMRPSSPSTMPASSSTTTSSPNAQSPAPSSSVAKTIATPPTKTSSSPPAPPHPDSHRPLLVWEPAPPFCNPSTLDAHLAAARLVDVFSPNHLELQRFFVSSRNNDDDDDEFDRGKIEDCARVFLDSGIGTEYAGGDDVDTTPVVDGARAGAAGKGILVVRAGEHGCLVASSSSSSSSSSLSSRGREGPMFWWLPVFSFGSSSSPSSGGAGTAAGAGGGGVAKVVVDATGAGNTFLGAFTYAMVAGAGGGPGEREAEGREEWKGMGKGDPVGAAAVAAVAASFAIQQVGLPVLSEGGEGGGEEWNGDEFGERMRAYLAGLDGLDMSGKRA